MTQLRLLIAIFLFSSLGLQAQTQPLTVSVSIPPVGYFVKALGQESVKVTSLVPENGSPEYYQPTFFKLKSLKKSDVIIVVGTLPFEEKLLNTLQDHPQLMVLSDARKAQDEHTWISLPNAIEQLTQIYTLLSQLNVIDQDVLKKRYFATLKTLNDLHASNQKLYANLAPGQVASYHPFLGDYFKDYSRAYRPLEEHGKPFTPRLLQDAVSELKTNQTKLIITANKGHAKKMKSLAKTLDVPVVIINPIMADYIAFHHIIKDELIKNIGYTEQD